MYTNEGLLIVISGPSGSGKGTVLKLLNEENNNIRFSISATTRNPRKGEIEGVNYFFKTKDEFKEMLQKDELVEWVEYCDNFYGTPKKYINESLKDGIDMILEIEVEGALNIKKNYSDCVLIFIIPPSFKTLRNRIAGRGTEEIDVINKRMEKAEQEIQLLNNYDYVVINDDLVNALEDIKSILKVEKLKTSRNKNILDKFNENTPVR